MRNRFIAWLPLALVAALHVAPARGQSVDVTINFVPTGVADWNVASNWSTVPDNLQFIPGDNFPREVASISNGGTAFINTATQFPIDGLLLGDGPGTNGTLELRSGGSLTVVDAAELEAGRDGGVFVGVDGRGSLLLNGGALNADFLIVGGASSSRVEARGSATVNISGDAILTRSFKTVGPNVNFNVGGNLVVTDRFEAEITGAAHAALKVPNGTATFGAPELSLRFTGVTPAFGNSWTLIDAQQIVGAFGPVSVVGTELPRGLVVTPDFDEAAGKLNVVVDNRLILKVDRKTGGTSIENAAGTPITIDGYTIASPGGHLLSTNARWSSLDDQNLAAFEVRTFDAAEQNADVIAGDAGIEMPEALFVANMLAPRLSNQTHLGTLLADHAGWRGIEASTVEAACASGGVAFQVAVRSVASGMIDVAAVCGVEKMTGHHGAGDGFGCRL